LLAVDILDIRIGNMYNIVDMLGLDKEGIDEMKEFIRMSY
jgi:hypothetical protein